MKIDKTTIQMQFVHKECNKMKNQKKNEIVNISTNIHTYTFFFAHAVNIEIEIFFKKKKSGRKEESAKKS